MQSSDVPASPAPQKRGTAKTRRLALFVAILALIAAVLVIWKPWDRCNAPEDICTFITETEKLDGVDSSKVAYEVTATDPKDGDSSQLSWEVVLDENLSPTQASELGAKISADLKVSALPHPKMISRLTFVSGSPVESQVPGLKLYPLNVSDSEQVQEQLYQAFNLRALGATSTGNLSATANNPEALLELAKYSAEHDLWVQLQLEDGSVNYSPLREVLVEEVELAIQIVALPSVQQVSFNNSQLSISLDTPSGSAVEAKTLRWLDQHEPLAEPTAYTVSPQGFAELTEGWVGGKKPDYLIPQPVRLPEGVDPWADNTNASACVAEDLQLSLTEPEPALGSRYMALYAKNISQQPCTLDSYPQVEFLNALGEPQSDVELLPTPSISLDPIAVPAGESAISTLKWGAMSTAQDPDQTTTLLVSAAPELKPVELTPQNNGTATQLDILDGATMEQSPWVQALEGWSVPGTPQTTQESWPRP